MALTVDWSFQLGSVVVDDSRPLKLVNFSPGNNEWRTDDAFNPVGDSRLFGDDYVTPPEWTLDVDCLSNGSESAEDAVARLSSVFDKRYANGSVVKLTYRRAGVERFVWGRPRGMSLSLEKGIPNKLIHAQVKFALADPLHYTAGASTVVMKMVPPPAGGFTAPFTSPIATQPTGVIQGAIDLVGGDVRVPFTVKFNGPITNPWIKGDDWSVKLTTSIATGMHILVDTRTYEIKRSDGANMSGTVSMSSRLAKARLNPFGAESIQFGGIDATGTSTAVLTWYPAYGTL